MFPTIFQTLGCPTYLPSLCCSLCFLILAYFCSWIRHSYIFFVLAYEHSYVVPCTAESLYMDHDVMWLGFRSNICSSSLLQSLNFWPSFCFTTKISWLFLLYARILSRAVWRSEKTLFFTTCGKGLPQFVCKEIYTFLFVEIYFEPNPLVSWRNWGNVANWETLDWWNLLCARARLNTGSLGISSLPQKPALSNTPPHPQSSTKHPTHTDTHKIQCFLKEVISGTGDEEGFH